jgi:hypothetical protein
VFGTRVVCSETPATVQLGEISNTGNLNDRTLLLAQRARRVASRTQAIAVSEAMADKWYVQVFVGIVML